MNDEWNQPGFSASDEEKKSEAPERFSGQEQPERTEQEQASSWGKPSEPQLWQNAQSEQSQPFVPQPPRRAYDSGPRYGGGYQNYNAPRAGQPNHARKKKSKAGLIIGITAGAICAILVGAVIMGAFLYPIFRDYQQTPGPSTGITPTPSASQGSGPVGGGDTDASIGGTAPTITDQINPIPEIAETALKSVVGVTTMQSQGGQLQPSARGTGFVISSSGYIVTNYHVIKDGEQFVVTDHDGNEYAGTLIGGDKNLDIAVLKIDAELPAVAIGDSDATRVGEQVIAIGDPSGAGQNLTGTVTVGYVSAVNRELMFNNIRQKFIQTDAAVNPGNSGGPLFNTKGEVVGVVTLKSLVSSANSGVSTEGIGFAIPINNAIDAAQQIISSGSVQRPGIGIRYSEVTQATAEANNLVPGNMIATFMNGSTAQQAGLQVGDIIIRCEGQDVTKVNMSDLVNAKKVGESIEVTVWRDGQEMDFTIPIGDVNQMTEE